MNVEFFFPLISAIIVFFLGIIIFSQGMKNKINLSFGFFALAITIWMFGTFMMLLNKEDVIMAIFWDKFIYLGVVFIPAVMYHFGIAITKSAKNKDKIILKFGYLLSFLFLLLIPTDFFVKDVFVYKWGIHTKAQLFHHIFLVYFAIYLFLWFNMVNKYYRFSASDSEKYSVRLVFISFFILAAIGSLGFLPAYGIGIYPFAYISGVIFSAILAYAIFKHRLFNIKLITAQIFTGIIWIILLLQIFGANTLTQRIIGVSVFLISVIFGVLLIRSVLNEIRQKERLAELSENLKEANDKLKELSQLKTDFVSMVTHQLRSPLTVIKGYGSMLADGTFGAVSGEAKNASRTILDSTERLISFVNDILDLNRIEEGRMQYNFEDVRIDEIVRSVFEELKPKAKEKNLEYKLEMPEEASCPKVSVDQLKIRQVIFNIIENSIKYTQEGFVAVSAEYDQAGHIVKIKVKDSGAGMSSEEMSHIFEKFRRTKASEKSSTKGSGVGLYVAREIARAHHGDVLAESAGEGKGSVFIIILPVNYGG